jgi:hypothetical protein
MAPVTGGVVGVDVTGAVLTGGVVGVDVTGAVLTGDVLEIGVAGAVLGAGAVDDDAGGVAVGVVVGGIVDPAGEVQTSNSDSPMLAVELLTVLTVNRTLFVDRELNVTTCALPALFSAGTVTDVPSPKVSRPAVTRSSEFGRSYRTTLLMVTALAQVNRSQLPPLPA